MPKAVVGHKKIKGRFHTGVLHFRNEHFGRNITLIGVVHSAHPGYYARIQAIIDDRVNDGYVVHCEGLTADGNTDRLLPDQQEAMKRGVNPHLRKAAIMRGLGLSWIAQREALTPGDDWRSVDVALVDVVRLAGPTACRLNPLEKMINGDDYATMEQRVAAGPAFLRKLTAKSQLRQMNNIAARERSRRGRKRLPDDRVVTHWRSIEATRAALAEESDLVMLWGAKHIEGIATMLGRNGYTVVDCEWLCPVVREFKQ